MFMAQLAQVIPATGRVILSSDIYHNLLIIFELFLGKLFHHEEHEEHKEKYLKDEEYALSELRVLRGLFT
jgi:hypothetical protein